MIVSPTDKKDILRCPECNSHFTTDEGKIHRCSRWIDVTTGECITTTIARTDWCGSRGSQWKPAETIGT